MSLSLIAATSISPVWASGPTFVDGAGDTRCNAGACSTQTVSLSVTTGNMIIVSAWRCCTSVTASASTDMTDSQSNSYTLRGDTTTLTGTGSTLTTIHDSVWTAVASATNTVTLTLSNEVNCCYTALNVVQYSGVRSIGATVTCQSSTTNSGGCVSTLNNGPPKTLDEQFSLTTTSANSVILSSVNGDDENNVGTGGQCYGAANATPPYMLIAGSATLRDGHSNPDSGSCTDGADWWDTSTTTAGSYSETWQEYTASSYYFSGVQIELKAGSQALTRTLIQAITISTGSVSKYIPVNPLSLAAIALFIIFVGAIAFLIWKMSSGGGRKRLSRYS